MSVKTRLFLFLVGLGVVFTIMGAKDWMCISKPAKDITELWEYDYSNLKIGDHICFDVTLVWDQIGSQVSQSKTLGVTTSERETGRFYLIPFCQDEDLEYIYPTPYLLAKISSSYNSLMDSQISKTDQWWQTEEDFSTVPGSSMHFDGRLVKMPADVRKHIEGNLDPGETLEDYMLPMMFEPIMAPGACKGITIVGIVCLLIGGVVGFLLLKERAGNQTVDYGMPRSQGTGYVPQSTNVAGAGAAFGGQPQNAMGNSGSAFAGGQPLGSSQPLGNQPMGATTSESSIFGTAPQPQNTMGNSGSMFAGQQPLGPSQPLGSQPMGAATSESSIFGTAPQPQNTMGNTGSMFAGQQPLGPSQPLGSQPLGATTSESSIFGTAPQPQNTEPASIFGSAPQPQPSEPASIFGNTPQAPTSEPASIFGNAPQASNAEPASIFGNTPQASNAEPASIFGNAPQASNAELASIFGNAPAQNPDSVNEDGTVRNMFGEVDVEATEKARKEKEEAERVQKEEEARAELLKAMAYASSHPAVLPMGGGGAAVQQSTQAAMLPLGGSPTQVSSGPATTPAAQPAGTPDNNASVPQPAASGSSAPTQNNNPLFGNAAAPQPAASGSSAPTQQNNNPLFGNAPTQNNNPLFGNAPAQQPATTGSSAPTQQNNNPLFGNAPAQQPVQSAAPEANENAPMYADNTEMKKVFSGAFSNNNNT